MADPVAFPRPASTVADFVSDDRGSATIWSLTWLLGFGIMAGLAIDSTNGWRSKTMLQSTADVAALAGAMELPRSYFMQPYDSSADAYAVLKDEAMSYADANQGMGLDEFGDYLLRDDIRIGHWEVASRVFTEGGEPVNAVRTDLFQNAGRNNGVPTSLLHMVGLGEWSIATRATAMSGVPKCYRDGMIADQKVCIESNNLFHADYCIHGTGGLNFKNGNTWEGGGQVSYGSDGSNNISDSNFENGLDEPSVDDTLSAPMVDQIPQIADGILTDQADYAYMSLPGPGALLEDEAGNRLGVLEIIDRNVISNAATGDAAWLRSGVELAYLGEMSSIASLIGLGATTGNPPFGCEGGASAGTLVEPYDGPIFTGEFAGQAEPVLQKNRVYYYSGKQNLVIDGDLEDVVIVSEAPISISGGVKLADVTLISMYDGNGPFSIKLGEGAQVGENDNCTPGGGVRMFGMGLITAPAGTRWYGAMVVSGGNICIAADSDSVEGLVAYAAGSVNFASNNTFGGGDSCADVAFTKDVYRAALVE